MKMTCEKCGFADTFYRFKYLGSPNWCSDTRECPRCGNNGTFTRADALENEEEEMKELSIKLASIRKDADETLLQEARDIIVELRRTNQRWNIHELDDFLNQRQRELKIGVGTR